MSLAMDYEVELDERYADGFADGEIKGFANGESKGRNDGIIEGEKKRSRDIAQRMLDGGLPLEQIAAFTGLSVEQVRELQR